mgnify:CR=1 FL=1
MPRSVNHVASRAKRKRILKLTRGYYGARKNVWTVAKNTWEKGLTYAFRDRRNKKRNFRALWIQRINAAARLEGMSYSNPVIRSLFISTVRLSLHRRICQNRHILFFCAPSSIVLDGVTLWVRGAKASLFV